MPQSRVPTESSSRRGIAHFSAAGAGAAHERVDARACAPRTLQLSLPQPRVSCLVDCLRGGRLWVGRRGSVFAFATFILEQPATGAMRGTRREELRGTRAARSAAAIGIVERGAAIANGRSCRADPSGYERGTRHSPLAPFAGPYSRAGEGRNAQSEPQVQRRCSGIFTWRCGRRFHRVSRRCRAKQRCTQGGLR